MENDVVSDKQMIGANRFDALSLGLPRYISDVPCKRGHIGQRYSADGACTECKRLTSASRSMKRWMQMSEEKKQKHREYCAEYRKKMTPEKRERHRISRLKSSRKRRGLPTPLRIEAGICEICGSDGKKRLLLDHCHSTGKFRGWLCIKCNSALGMVGDNLNAVISWTEKAVKYLKNCE